MIKAPQQARIVTSGNAFQAPKKTVISPAKLAKPGKPQPANAAIIRAPPMNGSRRSRPPSRSICTRAGLLVKVAAQAERERGEEAVRDHDQHRARHPDDIQGGNAEEDKAHVGDAGIADEPVEILLAHGDPAAIDEVAQAKPGEDLHPVLGGSGKQRQGDANQAVEAELLEHAGMEHGGGGGSGAVAERRPGVKRPERDENPEAEQAATGR